MSDVNSSVWHNTLSCLPIKFGETVDNFITLHCFENETSARGYNADQEQYVRDFADIFGRVQSSSGVDWQCNCN